MSKIYVDEIAGIASADTVAIPGHVIQVVQGEKTTNFSTTSGTLSSTGLSVTITPSSTTSKILVTFAGNVRYYKDGGPDARGDIKIYNGSSYISSARIRIYDYGGSGSIMDQPVSLVYLDTPATTSATTYTLYANLDTGTQMELNPLSSGDVSTMTAMEIAG